MTRRLPPGSGTTRAPHCSRDRRNGRWRNKELPEPGRVHPRKGALGGHRTLLLDSRRCFPQFYPASTDLARRLGAPSPRLVGPSRPFVKTEGRGGGPRRLVVNRADRVTGAGHRGRRPTSVNGNPSRRRRGSRILVPHILLKYETALYYYTTAPSRRNGDFDSVGSAPRGLHPSPKQKRPARKARVSSCARGDREEAAPSGATGRRCGC